MENTILFKKKNQATLIVEFGPLLSSIFRQLAEKEGVDPEALVFLWVAKPINKKWDFRTNQPREGL